MTRIFEGASTEAVDAAVAALAAGGVAILPGDTVYNFYGRADLRETVERVYEIKRRDRGKPFIVYTDLANVDRWGTVTAVAAELIAAFWPQALSLVLKKTAAIPDWFTADSQTVAVMTASNPVMTSVIPRVDAPLFGTTVNLAGDPYCTTSADARQFASAVDLIIADDGAIVYRAASTMVDCTVSPPAILREEAIPVEAIERVMPSVIVDLGRLK